MADEVIPRHYLYGIVIFTMLIIGGVTILGAGFNSSDSFGNKADYEQFNRSFNKLNELNEEIDTLEAGVTESSQEKASVWGFLDGLVNSVWYGIRSLSTSLSFATDIFTNLNTMFGIPTWVTVGIGMLITIMIVFSIISVIFKMNI